ncbi:MAG: hypothetical protein ACTSXD_06025 [Candidatus Heimdallarchaeaceae archaeon]
MGCGNEISDWDDKAVQDSLAGKNTELDPKILEETRLGVERTIEEKSREIENLKQPREERAMRLLEGGLSESKETHSSREMGKDVDTYKVFEVCPIEVKNFSGSWLGSNKNIMDVMSKLPQIGLLIFEEVRYTGKVDVVKDSEGKIGVVVGEATPEKSGRVSIKIGEHHPDDFKEQYPELDKLTPQEREQKMQQIETETFVHEYAEGVWRELTTLEERSQWRELHFQTMWEKGEFVTHRASDSPKEDFGECCAKFITEPEQLKQLDKNKYNFVKEFLSQLEKESQWLTEKFSEDN